MSKPIGLHHARSQSIAGITCRAENGPGRLRAGLGRAELPESMPGPARFVSSRSCCVSRSMPRVAFSLCLVMKISGKFPAT
jgi:hypothetical protein